MLRLPNQDQSYCWLCYWWIAVWHLPLIDIPRDEFYNLWVCSPQDPRSEHLSHHLHKNIWTCKIFYVNTPMGLIISSLSDCLTAESWVLSKWKYSASHNARPVWSEELGSVLVITKNKYHNQGLQRTIESSIYKKPRKKGGHHSASVQVEYLPR